MRPCQMCGAPTTNTPVLCDPCRVERATHHKEKGRVRWAALRKRSTP